MDGMETCSGLAHLWNARPGWSSAPLDQLDPRIVVALVDPARDASAAWRSDLEAIEYEQFHARGFVTDIDEHRSIYDPVLSRTHWAAVGWAPTGQVLSVCRMMRSSPTVLLPVLAALEEGCMRIDDIPALVDARNDAGSAIEATLATVPKDRRPRELSRPTELCHGLFMAFASMSGCRWILSAVDPGALDRSHRHAAAGAMLETVGGGQDTAGVESLVVVVGVDQVLDAVAGDVDSPMALAMRVGRELALDQVLAAGAMQFATATTTPNAG